MSVPANGVVVADSVTKPTADWCGAVLVAGSHGGVYAAYCAVRAGVRGVILNDAGKGKDDAGIGGAGYCDDISMPFAAVDTMSARIGDGADMAHRGVISTANRTARDLGVQPGLTVAEAAHRMTSAALSEKSVPVYEEARTELPPGPSGRRIVLLDSASLISDADAGHVIICGSHGGIPGSDAAAALKVDAWAAFFNDAGGGADGAGFTRLPALDSRGIAAATVAAMSARIGDGRSTYEDGILSRVNQIASRYGAKVGMPLRDAVAVLVD